MEPNATDIEFSFNSPAFDILYELKSLETALNPIACSFLVKQSDFTRISHTGKSPDRQQSIKEPSEILSFSLVYCIITYSRSQYIFG